VRGRRFKFSPPGAPSWLFTFADLMCLLLTFFILLLSFSSVNEAKFSQAAVSMAGGFRPLPALSTLLSSEPRRPPTLDSEAWQAARKLRRMLQVRGMEQSVKIEFDALGGIKITLPAALLFEGSESALKPSALPVLEEMALILSELQDNFFEVHGHTDSEPLAGTPQIRDNYDLSYQRAHSVAEQLVISGNLALNRFEIHANGASQPAATNDTIEGRVSNRRVEIYVRGLLDREKLNRLLQSMEMDQDPVQGDDTPPPGAPDNPR
jgi:chemotaxis protein MotB